MTYSNPLCVFRYHWLLCLVGGVLVLSQVLFVRPSACRLSNSGWDGCLLFRAAERSCWCGVICCERHCKTCLYLWTGLSPITLVVDGIRPMAFESRVDYLQLPFRIGLDSGLFMFWLQSQNTRFNQRLNFVLKDIAPASRMMNHPMEKIIVGIVRSSHFVWASNLWQLELVAFIE